MDSSNSPLLQRTSTDPCLTQSGNGEVNQQPVPQMKPSTPDGSCSWGKHVTDTTGDVQTWDSISENSFDSSYSIRLGSATQDNTSATTWSSMPTLNLPFLKKLPPIESVPRLARLPHYRLVLNIDKKIEAATVQTAFGPVVSILRRGSQNLNEEPKELVHPTREHGNLTALTREPVQPNNNGDDGKINPNDISTEDGGTGSIPGRGRRSDSRGTNEEYPRAPPNTPIETTPEPEKFSNGLFEVRSSATAGFGAFALTNLIRGQTILVERALFHANDFTLYDEIDRLTPSLQQAFGRMHAHKTHSNGSHDMRAAIFRTNSFLTSYNKRGVFLIASRFNHACKPINNVEYVFDRRQNFIVFSAGQDIEAGEELFINYGKDPEFLYIEYGFICKCGGCRLLTDAEIADLQHPIR